MAGAPPFYLVWREGGGTPVYQHQTEHSAQQECRRLSRENPGMRFCVLAPITRIVTAMTTVEHFDASDQIPF